MGTKIWFTNLPRSFTRRQHPDLPLFQVVQSNKDLSIYRFFRTFEGGIFWFTNLAASSRGSSRLAFHFSSAGSSLGAAEITTEHGHREGVADPPGGTQHADQVDVDHQPVRGHGRVTGR